MARFGDVRAWDSGPLHNSVGELNRRYDQLIGLADELTASCQPPGWAGDAAYTAATESKKHTDRLEEQVAGVAAVRRALGEAADAVDGLKHAIAEVDSLAAANGFRVTDDGAIIAGPWVGAEGDRERARAELVDRVEQVLRRAQDIDDDLTTVVNRARTGQTLDHDVVGLTSAAQAGVDRGGLSVEGPPRGGSVYDNAGWWDALSDVEKQRVLKEHPDWIGNLDGVPASARDAANRARIPGERPPLQRQLDDLKAKVDDVRHDSRLDPRARMAKLHQLTQDMAKVQAKLDSLTSIERILAHSDRQLLVLDVSGDRAKAAIGSGNVDTADHVAVFTPGMNSRVDGGSLEGYVNDMERLQRKSVMELAHQGQDKTVAMVTWLDYEPPNTGAELLESTTEGRAKEGADRLAPFLNGIDASRDHDPHLTALGHSYGSVTTGLALQQKTGVDDVVVFGSPGIGTSDPARVLVPSGQLYNLEADGDIVADLGDPMFHGADPSSMHIPQLSTHDALTPDGRPLHASHGHSEYVWEDTTSQYNMAVIVAGMNDRVVRD